MHDFRLAFRSLRSTPIVNTVVVLSLALGIGANTAIFSVVDSLVLRSLPVSEPQRLFMLSTNVAGTNRPQFSYSTLKQIRTRGDLFDGVMGYTSCCGKSIVIQAGARQMVDRQFVTGDFFTTLGVQPFRGRLVTPADDEPGAPYGPVAVISHRFWRERLAGRDEAVGATLTIDGTRVTIVGVAPPSFFGVDVGRVVDLMIPQHLAGRLTSSPFDDDNAWLNVIVRLKPGISVATANGGLRAAQPEIRAASTPRTFPNARFLQDPFTLEPAAAGMSTLRQRFERPLVVIFVLVSLVLVIACANIANLLLARGVARRHELSVRVALGASRWRLVRQLIAESLLLSSVGAAIGLVLASWVTRVLLSQVSSARAPIVLETAVDWRVLAFTVTTMMVTAMLFGTAPALRLTDVVPTEAMRQGRGTIGHRRGAVSHSLVVVQIVLSLLLVVGAGLFVQTFERLVRVSLGFDPDRTLVVTVAAPTVPADDRPMLFHRLAEAVRTVPGVTAVGGALNPPIIGGLAGDLVVSAPGTAPQPDAERIPQFDSITPGWFAGYGIPIERGRDFDERDRIGAPPVMLVNDAFVRRLFPGRDVIGMPLTMTFRLAIGDFPYGVRTIVGVVADSVFRSLRDPVRPMIYVPLAQRESIPQKDMYLGVRSASGSPALLERSVAAAITAFSRDVAFTFQPLAQQVDESLANDRVMAMLSGFFGGLALLLAALGLYGVTAYGVAQRRAEIGIRMALGAAPANIMRLVLTRVSLLVSVGVAVGALTSIWASNFVSAMLFGLEPRDPATLVGAIAILAATGSIAGWLPAYRASRIDPSEVLRDA